MWTHLLIRRQSWICAPGTWNQEPEPDIYSVCRVQSRHQSLQHNSTCCSELFSSFSLISNHLPQLVSLCVTSMRRKKKIKPSHKSRPSLMMLASRWGVKTHEKGWLLVAGHRSVLCGHRRNNRVFFVSAQGFFSRSSSSVMLCIPAHCHPPSSLCLSLTLHHSQLFVV